MSYDDYDGGFDLGLKMIEEGAKVLYDQKEIAAYSIYNDRCNADDDMVVVSMGASGISFYVEKPPIDCAECDIHDDVRKLEEEVSELRQEIIEKDDDILELKNKIEQREESSTKLNRELFDLVIKDMEKEELEGLILDICYQFGKNKEGG